MTDDGASRWRLGFTPERRWTEWEQLAQEPVLLARLGAGGAALVATGVRELLTNVVQHGSPGASDAELRLDGGAGTLQLIIPGNAFDSVSLACDDPRGFLSCFGAMLAEDGIEWSHRYEDGNNHLLMSLAGARIWRSRGEER